MCSCMTAAVQHERGPRKPKHHQHHGKDLHHHHHHHHHMGSPPALGGVPVLQAPVDAASSVSAKLLFPGAPAPPVKHSTIGAATSGGDHSTVPAPPPTAAMFLAHQPPPPGLLQILMSAEKCQVNNITSHFFRLCTKLSDAALNSQDFPYSGISRKTSHFPTVQHRQATYLEQRQSQSPVSERRFK
jgi:hypothetical protein